MRILVYFLRLDLMYYTFRVFQEEEIYFSKLDIVPHECTSSIQAYRNCIQLIQSLLYSLIPTLILKRTVDTISHFSSPTLCVLSIVHSSVRWNTKRKCLYLCLYAHRLPVCVNIYISFRIYIFHIFYRV